MKYIITEKQYRLMEEQEEILKIPFGAFGDDWNLLQKFLERRGYPPYEIIGDLNLFRASITSLGNLTFVGGDLDLYETPIASKYTKEEIRQMVNVEGTVYF